MKLRGAFLASFERYRTGASDNDELPQANGSLQTREGRSLGPPRWLVRFSERGILYG